MTKVVYTPTQERRVEEFRARRSWNRGFLLPLASWGIGWLFLVLLSFVPGWPINPNPARLAWLECCAWGVLLMPLIGGILWLEKERAAASPFLQGLRHGAFWYAVIFLIMGWGALYHWPT